MLLYPDFILSTFTFNHQHLRIHQTQSWKNHIDSVKILNYISYVKLMWSENHAVDFSSRIHQLLQSVLIFSKNKDCPIKQRVVAYWKLPLYGNVYIFKAHIRLRKWQLFQLRASHTILRKIWKNPCLTLISKFKLTVRRERNIYNKNLLAHDRKVPLYVSGWCGKNNYIMVFLKILGSSN